MATIDDLLDDKDSRPNGTAPKSTQDVEYEFTISDHSLGRAAEKTTRAVKTGLETKLAVDEAIEHRRQVQRQARRAKLFDGLKILGLITRIFT